MRRILAPVFHFLAWATHPEMRRMVAYLKEENRILRSKLPRRVPITPGERSRLVRLGKRLGLKLREIVGIVSYRTFLRWCETGKEARKHGPKVGRPQVLEPLEALVLRLALENSGWGYTRILGELRKLGMGGRVSRNTVKNILRRHGLDPGPRRGPGSWDEFIRIHLKTLWACDFVVKKVLTKRGFVEYFLLFFLHLGTRRVHVGGITAHPDGSWMANQARNLCMYAEETAPKPTILVRDRDRKFTEHFDAILGTEGIRVKVLPSRTPNLNAFAERWVQSLKVECLDHFLVLGEAHLRHIVTEYVAFHNRLRPHQAMGNEVLSDERPPPDARLIDSSEVKCQPILGGLLNHYYRDAG